MPTLDTLELVDLPDNLHAFEQHLLVYKGLLEAVDRLAQPEMLDIAAMLPGLRAWVKSSAAEPSLAAAARYQRLFEREPELGRALLAWGDVVEKVVVPQIDIVRRAADAVDAPGASERFSDAVLYLADSVARTPRSAPGTTTVRIAQGLVTLADALRAWRPDHVSPAFTFETAEDAQRFADRLGKVLVRGEAAGVALSVLPALRAVHRVALSIVADPRLPDTERLRDVPYEGGRDAFAEWFELVRRESSDTLGDDETVGIDVTLLMLECAVRGNVDRVEEATMGLLTRKLTLAQAVAQALD